MRRAKRWPYERKPSFDTRRRRPINVAEDGGSTSWKTGVEAERPTMNVLITITTTQILLHGDCVVPAAQNRGPVRRRTDASASLPKAGLPETLSRLPRSMTVCERCVRLKRERKGCSSGGSGWSTKAVFLEARQCVFGACPSFAIASLPGYRDNRRVLPTFRPSRCAITHARR